MYHTVVVFWGETLEGLALHGFDANRDGRTDVSGPFYPVDSICCHTSASFTILVCGVTIQKLILQVETVHCTRVLYSARTFTFTFTPCPEPFHFTLHIIALYVCAYVLVRNWQLWVVNKGGCSEDGKRGGRRLYCVVSMISNGLF